MKKTTTATPPAWVKDIRRAAKQRGTAKLTKRQIDTEITAARRELRKKKAG